MRTYQPIIIGCILCSGITLLLTYLIWGRNFIHNQPARNETGLEEAALKGKAAVVLIFTITSDNAGNSLVSQRGSGIIISEDGYIVTNHHVISGADEIRVQLDDRREIHAELLGTDTDFDVALLKINADGLPFLSFGNSDSIHIGERALAIGNPLNLLSSVTFGIISAVDRDFNMENNATHNLIQTDAAIKEGYSGGALVNAQGKLIGMNLAKYSMSGSYEGFSFALPSNLVKKIADDIRQYGSNQRGSIDMIVRPINMEIAHDFGVSWVHGVMVDALEQGGAADLAGLKSLDIILSVNGAIVRSTPDYYGMLELKRPGDSLTMIVLRNAKLDTVGVTMGELN